MGKRETWVREALGKFRQEAGDLEDDGVDPGEEGWHCCDDVKGTGKTSFSLGLFSPFDMRTPPSQGTRKKSLLL